MTLITSVEYEDLIPNADLSGKSATYVESVLASVSRALKDWCGRSFEMESVVEKTTARLAHYRGQSALYIQTRRVPINAVTSLEVWYIVDDNEPSTIDITNIYIDEEIGDVWVAYGLFGTWRAILTSKAYLARITYTAGEGTVPVSIKRAAALLAQEQFDLDDRNAESDGSALDGPIASYSVGGEYSVTFAQLPASAAQGLGLGTRNALMAARLARPYRREGGLFI